MSTLAATTQTNTSSAFKRVLSRLPLVSYFVMAFAGTWITLLPIVLSKKGLGLLPYDMPFLLFAVLFIASTYLGPALSAFVMTGITGGKAGVRQLLRRCIQWRAGIQWYLIVLFGLLIMDLLGLSVVSGTTLLHALEQKWYLTFTTFLPSLVTFSLVITVGEEIGWRGFALPRLQQQYGPLPGSIILGTLHGLWHLPTFFIVGLVSNGAFSLLTFVVFVLSAVLSTILFTWVFNNTGGSLLIMFLLHGTAQGERTTLLHQFLPVFPGGAGLWISVVYIVALALVIILTRGRLSYKPERNQRLLQPAAASQPAETKPVGI